MYGPGFFCIDSSEVKHIGKTEMVNRDSRISRDACADTGQQGSLIGSGAGHRAVYENSDPVTVSVSFSIRYIFRRIFEDQWGFVPPAGKGVFLSGTYRIPGDTRFSGRLSGGGAMRFSNLSGRTCGEKTGGANACLLQQCGSVVYFWNSVFLFSKESADLFDLGDTNTQRLDSRKAFFI